MDRSIRRAGAALGAALLVIALTAAPALACGGLIGPNGAVNLLRTTTLAGYHDGQEHYITAFEFAGGGGAFGSLTPLPGIPSSVEKGGDWTLQRLIRETEPQPAFALDAVRASAAGSAEELMKVRIDALDVTVLRGGSAAVGTWATEHGFRLPPDAPEVLDFYAARSPIFLAAVFDADAAAARGQAVGDGTPVHITIPTSNPWVPLRILALGKTAAERVEADVYLLTDRTPTLLPAPTGDNGLGLGHSAPATQSLLDDLRSDKGMGWVPTSAWLSKVRIDASAPQLAFDLAIDATGAGAPSRIMAGLDMPGATVVAPDRTADVIRIIVGLTLHDRRHRRDPPAGPPAPAAVDGLSVGSGGTMDAHRRPGRLALVGGIALSLGLAGIAAAWAHAPGLGPVTETIGIHYSHYDRSLISVPAGVAVTIVLRNDDPIDHEFIVGDAAVHERHRTGTEPVHASRPTEVTIPAGTTRATTITFTTPGSFLFICHLPGHEAYGMVGTLVVRGS